MAWTVLLHPEFDPEFAEMPDEVQEEIASLTRLLQQFGPQLGRPHADSLKGSRHANMKELRFRAADGAWRVAFAFDPARQAVLLVAGDKAGKSEARFYRSLIARADRRLDHHLAELRGR
ncbi:MAG: type II toxin-antitoxin system RelE/ParE family toxin [Alphaproteobacteria bacterium]